MTRKAEAKAQEIKERIDELHNVKVFLNANLDELNVLQEKLRNGDNSVIDRVRELFDLIDEKRIWINRNVPIIKEALKAS